jgi:hypothetical protein
MRAYLRNLSCLASVAALTGGLLAVSPVATAGATVAGDQAAAVCSGTPSSPGVLTGTFTGDVVVKGACEVNAGPAVVDGNLTLRGGSALLAAFALNDKTGHGKSSLTVHGDLQVSANATLLLGCNPANFACLDDPHQHKPTLSMHAVVGKDLVSQRPLGVIVHNTSIGGNLTQFGGGGGTNCTPKGVFKLFNSPVYSTYEVGSVGGNVFVTGVRSCWMGLVSLKVGGDMRIRNNELADPDAIEILANHITGDLVCRGNSMTWDSEDIGNSLFPRKPLPNTVGGKRAGQCVLSSPTKPGGPKGPGPF